jgi:hypothetical protein
MSALTDIFKLTPEQAAQHRIRHYVYLIDSEGNKELVPRESTMRGEWPCEAKCSCGWETQTGGGVASWVKQMVQDHKFAVKHGFAD